MALNLNHILYQWHSPAARQAAISDMMGSIERPEDQQADPLVRRKQELDLEMAQMQYEREREKQATPYDRWAGKDYTELAANPMSPAYEWVDKTGAAAPNKGIQISLAEPIPSTGGASRFADSAPALPDLGLKRGLITGPRQEAMMADTRSQAYSNSTDSEESRNWRIQYDNASNALNTLLKNQLADPKSVEALTKRVQDLEKTNPANRNLAGIPRPTGGNVGPPPPEPPSVSFSDEADPRKNIALMGEAELRELLKNKSSLTMDQKYEADARWKQLGLKP